ncbi:MAG: HPr(Ser) kinase/phosphatase [Verrucomicrobia bacterium]|nr:HPr(Ser) kinase/phosphatase [Verrucomicrobiota bacterium]
MRGIRVGYLYERMADELRLTTQAGERGMNRRIKVAEVERPGLAMTGFFDYFAWRRIQVLGKVEIFYMRSLPSDVRRERIRRLMERNIPCMIVARNYRPPEELLEEANSFNVPLFRTPLITMNLVNRLTLFLDEEFAPTVSIPGNMVEVYGVGVLIRGKGGVGKSETSLGLIEKGHRLITDDIVRIRLREGRYLVGTGAELTRHHMEIRGLGIINVQALFGAVCFKEEAPIDLVVTLERWDPEKEYERLGIEEETISILGKPVPHLLIPVRVGRDIVLMVETAALTHRLKATGYNPAKQLNERLVGIMTKP